jgi:hypothetical protein
MLVHARRLKGEMLLLRNHEYPQQVEYLRLMRLLLRWLVLQWQQGGGRHLVGSALLHRRA